MTKVLCRQRISCHHGLPSVLCRTAGPQAMNLQTVTSYLTQHTHIYERLLFQRGISALAARLLRLQHVFVHVCWRTRSHTHLSPDDKIEKTVF